MSEKNIKRYLDILKKDDKYDKEFIDILTVGDIKNEDGKTIAAKVIESIKRRYDENKKNQA
jgi:hypothetical protein